MSRISIAFLTAGDAEDKTTWSGTPYYCSKALQDYVGDVDFLGPYKPFWAYNFGRVKTFLIRKILKKNFDYKHSLNLSKTYGKFFSIKLKQKKYDLIFACSASSELAFIDTNTPIIYFTDGTFARMVNYHPGFTNLTNSSIEQGMKIEQLAINKSAAIVYPSEWAKQSAIKDYGAEENKITIVPLGANIDNLPDNQTLVNNKNNYLKHKITLLFLGVNWKFKGGDIAINAFKYLIKNNIDAELIICGCIPPFEIKDKKIKIIPFLNKNENKQREQLMELFYKSDFLILPTRTDCYGIVFCEASAFGIPSLATNTGGVGGVIKEGINGFLFDYDDQGIGYANKIIELLKTPEMLIEIKSTSRKIFEEKLNWKAWAKNINELDVVNDARGFH